MKGYYKGKEVAICINQKEGRWLNIPITADGIVTSVTATLSLFALEFTAISFAFASFIADTMSLRSPVLSFA